MCPFCELAWNVNFTLSWGRPIGPSRFLSATLKNSHEILKYFIRHLSEIGKRIWPKKSSKTHNPSKLFFYGHQGTIQGLWPIVRRSPTPLRLPIAVTIQFVLFGNWPMHRSIIHFSRLANWTTARHVSNIKGFSRNSEVVFLAFERDRKRNMA